MIKIETELKTFLENLHYYKQLFLDEKLFYTGIDVLDQKLGPFSIDCKYLFISTQKSSLAPLWRTINYQTKLLYQTNLSKNVFDFKYLFNFKEDSCVFQNIISSYDVVIELRLGNFRNIISLNTGDLTEANLEFFVLKPCDSNIKGMLILNPNLRRVFSDLEDANF